MQATLAAVIITAVIFSVEHHVVKPVWNSKREKYFALIRYIFAKEYIINTAPWTIDLEKLTRSSKDE